MHTSSTREDALIRELVHVEQLVGDLLSALGETGRDRAEVRLAENRLEAWLASGEAHSENVRVDLAAIARERLVAAVEVSDRHSGRTPAVHCADWPLCGHPGGACPSTRGEDA